MGSRRIVYPPVRIRLRDHSHDWWLDDGMHDAQDTGDPPSHRADDGTWRRGPSRRERWAALDAARAVERAKAAEERAERLRGEAEARRARLGLGGEVAGEEVAKEAREIDGEE